MMCLVLSQLPGNTREKQENIMYIKQIHLTELNFTDIIHFVDYEVTLANDPLFSIEVLSGYID